MMGTATDVQFDHDGDGSPEGSAPIDATNGSFVYDPFFPQQLRRRFRSLLSFDGDRSWNTFSMYLDHIMPSVILMTPPDGGTFDPSSAVPITAQFNEPIDPMSIDSSMAWVESSSGDQPSQMISASDDTLEISLDPMTLMEFTYTTRIQGVPDLAGNIACVNHRRDLVNWRNRWRHSAHGRPVLVVQ